MRLHDAENGLLSLEEENSFLRQQCQDFESELFRRRTETNELISELQKQCAESIDLENELEHYRIDYKLMSDKLRQRQAENNKLFKRLSLLEEKQSSEFTENQDKIKTDCQQEKVLENQKNNDCTVSISSQLLTIENNENAKIVDQTFDIKNEDEEKTNIVKQTIKAYSNGKINFLNESNLFSYCLIKNVDVEQNVPSVSFIGKGIFFNNISF